MRKTVLSKLIQGERAVVLDISGGMRERLNDLGLIKGTAVTCVRKSPLGDPVAYLIRGAVIALRSEDSSCVTVKI
ncbi:MAG: ferrous iron transport protein A [Oscillospiraceae bacterium]|nr:ferrous iron transport protein A [Oscillospiraceae bacterium]